MCGKGGKHMGKATLRDTARMAENAARQGREFLIAEERARQIAADAAQQYKLCRDAIPLSALTARTWQFRFRVAEDGSIESVFAADLGKQMRDAHLRMWACHILTSTEEKYPIHLAYGVDRDRPIDQLIMAIALAHADTLELALAVLPPMLARVRADTRKVLRGGLAYSEDGAAALAEELARSSAIIAAVPDARQAIAALSAYALAHEQAERARKALAKAEATIAASGEERASEADRLARVRAERRVREAEAATDAARVRALDAIAASRDAVAAQLGGMAAVVAANKAAA